MKNIFYLFLLFIVGFLFGWFVLVPALKYYSGETNNKEIVTLESLVNYASNMVTVTNTHVYKAAEFTELGDKDSASFYLDSALLYHFHANTLNEYLKVLNEAN